MGSPSTCLSRAQLFAVALCLAISAHARADERAAGGAAPTAPGGGVVIERLEGPAIEGRQILALGGGEVTVGTKDGNVVAKLADVVEISLPTASDPPRAHGANEVAVDLWSGETIHGDLRGGDGEQVRVASPLIGTVDIALDRVAGVRFLARLAQSAEPPDLRSRKDGDQIFMAGGDQFTATVEKFGETSFKCVTPQKDKMELAYDRLVAVRLMASDAGAPPKSGMRLALRDGTRIVASEPRLEGDRVKAQSVSGFAVSCALSDIVAAQVLSPAFAYASDLEPSKVEVKPVWEMVAGDPAVLYAPRMDQSFTGKPLRSGGRSWLDGIGVFSGTTLRFDLDGKYREFRCHAGLDDGAGKLGGVIFKVLVDGKEAWNSGFVRAAGTTGRGTAGPLASPRIPLTDAKTLELVVLAGDDEDPYPVQDEADWLGALLVRERVDGSSAR